MDRATDEEIKDYMRDALAFVHARYKDDEEGGVAIMRGGNYSGLLLGVTDLTLTMIRILCEVMGISMDTYMETMRKTGGRVLR